MTPTWRWTFSSSELGSVRFLINPNSGGLPIWQKQIEVTSSTSGSPVLFEGRQQPVIMPFSGAILEEAHWTFFRTWYESGYSVSILDDLGNNIPNAYLTKFAPKRKVRHSHPWAGDYECEALVWGISTYH